jgi:DNA-binding GntR family transcriptional regulator
MTHREGETALELGSSPIGERHRTLDAVVCDELRKQIITGELAPGVRLVENAIADELGVSRGPVRVAIRQLEREGFVVVSPRRGASVADVSAPEALECYEVRIALEALAASLAAERRTEEDLASMRAVLRKGDEMLVSDRWDVLAQLNNDFHVALAMASRNTQLVLLMGQYAKRIAWMFARSAEQRGQAAWAEHAGIVAAVEAGDAAKASRLARSHIERSRQQFMLTAGPAGSQALDSILHTEYRST